MTATETTNGVNGTIKIQTEDVDGPSVEVPADHNGVPIAPTKFAEGSVDDSIGALAPPVSPEAPTRSKSITSFGNSGLLMVYVEPKGGKADEEFLHIYNQEFGPMRMGLSWMHDGRFYQARDGKTPSYCAFFDVDDLTKLDSPEYIELSDKASDRAKKLYEDGLEVVEKKAYKQMSVRGDEGTTPVRGGLVYTMWVPEEHAEEIHAWYEKDHTGHVAAVPGWKCTRRYRNTAPREDGLVELMALHQFEDSRGTGGPEHMAAKEQPWRKRVVHELVTDDSSRKFRLACKFSDPKTGSEAYFPPPPKGNVSAVANPMGRSAG